MKKHPYILATLIATLLSTIVWLCIPKEYSAVTKLSDEYKEVDLAVGLNNMSARLRDIMGSANTGMNNMEVYCKVLKTESFARAISHKQVPGTSMTYGEYLGEKDTIEAILHRIVYNYSERQTSLSISFSDRNPKVASQMLDSVTTQLQNVVTTYRHTMAEVALQNARIEMRTAEQKYHQAQKSYNSFMEAHTNLNTSAVKQQAMALEKEIIIAYNKYKEHSNQYIRQQALKQRSYLSFAVIQNNSVPLRPNSYFIGYLLSFITIALLITYGNKCYRKQKEAGRNKIAFGTFISPWTISIIVWVSILGLYYLLDTDLYLITSQFYYCFSIWIPFFCICSILTYNLLPTRQDIPSNGYHFNFNKSVFTFFFVISLVITPLYVYRVMQIVMMFDADDLMNNIRTLAIYGEGQGFLNHSAVINQALFIVALWAYPRVPLWQVFVVTIACLLNAFAIMEKGTMFFVFFCLMFVLFEKKVIKLRSIVISGCVLVLFFYIFNIMRTTNDDYDASDTTFIDFVAMYILSPPVAFSQLQPDVTPQFGSNTFETIYHFMRRLGVTSVIEKQKIQEFIWVPICTNVYTVFQAFFIDFGYKGIAFFSLIYGTIYGWAYRLYQNGSSIGLCIYTFLAQILILQFYQENIFQSIAFVFEFAFFVFLMCYKNSSFSISLTIR